MKNLKTLQEVCYLWVNKDFSFIPTSLITRTYQNDCEDLQCLNSEEFLNKRYEDDHDWSCMWGSMFHPELSLDEEWIKENINKVENCGFLVYNCNECGILLAIDGADYDFYTGHWEPLYKTRGLQWHDYDDRKNTKTRRILDWVKSGRERKWIIDQLIEIGMESNDKEVNKVKKSASGLVSKVFKRYNLV